MNELLAHYQKQSQRLSKVESALQAMQKTGAQELFRLGFPTRNTEDWKYTPLKQWSSQAFAEADAASAPLSVDAVLSEAYVIAFSNGQVVEAQSNIPSSISVLSLEEACGADWATPYLDQILQGRHAFHALNSAMLQKGLAIYIPDGVQLDKPIYLLHEHSAANCSTHLRHLLVMGKQSQACVVEDFFGNIAEPYYTNHVLEVYLDASAMVQHYWLQREASAATHIGHIAVAQQAHSRFDHHGLSIGGALVRHDVSVDFRGEHAQCFLNGVYAPNDGQHIDHHIYCNHHVPHCHSEQLYRGILQGKSKAVFNGVVYVAKDAQKSESHQQNKNILLSNLAEVDTKPQLEIFADDVICSHGATVGALDEDALFYLATRGIDRHQATQFLIEAFAIENFGRMDQKALAHWMQGMLCQQMR